MTRRHDVLYRKFSSGLALMLLLSLMGCSRKMSAKPDIEKNHYILIQACDHVVDAYDPTDRKTTVPQNEFAVWINQTDQPVTLRFGNAHTLFGQPELVVPPRKQRPLRVLPNADLIEHAYKAECPTVQQPGPVIIVTPPEP